MRVASQVVGSRGGLRTDKHEAARRMADSMVFREASMSTMPNKALKRRQWVMTDWGRR